MALKGTDSNPLICGRLQLSSNSRIYYTGSSGYEKYCGGGNFGNWTSVYLKGCSWDGTGITFPEAGKYAFTLRMGIAEGSFDNIQFYLDLEEDGYGGVQGGWTWRNGSVRTANLGTCFINWSSIGNFYPGSYVTMRSYIYDPNGGIGYWIIPDIDLPRAPILEWFRISENIGERSRAAWYWGKIH